MYFFIGVNHEPVTNHRLHVNFTPTVSLYGVCCPYTYKLRTVYTYKYCRLFFNYFIFIGVINTLAFIGSITFDD